MSFIDKYADFIAKQQKDLRSSTVNTIEEGKMTRSDIAALEDPKDKIDAKDFAALRAGKHKKKIKDEEEENLDELSKDTLARYALKAHNRGDMATRMRGKGPDDEMNKIANKRYIGVQTAIKKLVDDRPSLKRKRKKDEEEENLDEVLTKKQPTSEWIRDFIASKNPKFAGKSKGKRREMAIAAYYAKQREE